MFAKENFNLKKYNTFGMDVNCKMFVQIDDDDEIVDVAQKYLKNEKFCILSGGSNTLFTGNYNGVVLHPNTHGISIVEESRDFAIVKAAAGEQWDTLINFCIKNKLYGVENLTAIPGLVGSSPVQNIGAYGVEVKDTILKVEGYNILNGKKFELLNENCHFEYRNSIFKADTEKKLFITHVYFRLSKTETFNLTYSGLRNKIQEDKIILNLKNISNAIREIRNSKLPDYKEIGNGGSFFKNPVVSESSFKELAGKYPDLTAFDTTDGAKKLSAGQLIEKAGWKGKRIGDAGVYPKQALVLVNYGTATPKEIIDLADNIIRDVENMFGVKLVKEINCV